jgi:hypothetical protein
MDTTFWIICSRYDREFAALEYSQKSGEKYPILTGNQYDPKGILTHRCKFHNKNHFDEAKAKELVDKMNAKGGLKRVSGHVRKPA